MFESPPQQPTLQGLAASFWTALAMLSVACPALAQSNTNCFVIGNFMHCNTTAPPPQRDMQPYRDAGAALGAALAPRPLILGWSSAGHSYNEYMSQRYECIRDVRSGDGTVSRGMFSSCMIQNGWVQDDNGFKPPAGAVVPMVP